MESALALTAATWAIAMALGPVLIIPNAVALLVIALTILVALRYRRPLEELPVPDEEIS